MKQADWLNRFENGIIAEGELCECDEHAHRKLEIQDHSLLIIYDYTRSKEGLSPMLSGDVVLGGLVDAINFDPPEDHPSGFEDEEWPAMVVDFRDTITDLESLESLRSSGHFKQLLHWQPRVNKSTTLFFAWICLQWSSLLVLEVEAAILLGQELANAGYDAIIVSPTLFLSEDVESLDYCSAFAYGIRKGAHLPIILATEVAAPVTPPFDFSWRRTTLHKLLLRSFGSS